VFGTRFVALVAHGTSASVAFAESLGPDDLHALGPLVEIWHRDGLATPLVMTPDEFRRSLDAFPLEYQSILDHHVVIAGTPPFAGAEVPREDLRRACEIQARGHLIHLREGWIEAGGHDDHLIELLVHSAAPFEALIANVARLSGAPAAGDDDLAAFAESTLGLPSAVVAAILDLNRHPEHGRTALAMLPEYLSASESLWDAVDRWRDQ